MSEFFIGQVMMTGFGFAPRFWALCNGQLLPINQNQALFSLLGTIAVQDDITIRFALFGLACGCSSAFDNIYNTSMTEASCPETKLRSMFMSFAFSSFVLGQILLSVICYFVHDSN